MANCRAISGNNTASTSFGFANCTIAIISGNTAYTVRVEVFLERGQQPTRRMSGSMNSGSAFNDLKAVPTELSRRGIDGYYWEPVGHDSYLEQRLLRELLERTEIAAAR